MDIICCICVEKSVKDNLKPVLTENVELTKKLRTFINIEEYKDLTSICYTCSDELDIAYDFVNKCANASQRLRDYSLNNGRHKISNVAFACDGTVLKNSDSKEFTIIKEEDYAEHNKSLYTEYEIDISKHELCSGNPKQTPKDWNLNQCDVCSQSFPNQLELKSHSKSQHKKIYKCNECSREFKHRGSLKAHLQSHEVFACPICPREFTTKNRLMRHTRSHNDDKYCFKCSVCPKKFTVACNLTRHMMIHEGVKPFVCETCGKSFSQKVVLQTHMKTHDRLAKAIESNLTDGSTCKICQCSFENTKCLFSHLTRHHGNTYNKKMLVKSYQCEECGKCLRGYKTWRLHQGTHTGLKPFPCDICGKSFRLRELLKRHKRVHTGEKPYQCMVCTMHFGAHANLIKHLRKHTGEKPFKCQYCEMAFSSSFNMRRHAARHEKKSSNKTIDVT